MKVFAVCAAAGFVLAYTGYLVWLQIKNRAFSLKLTLEALLYTMCFGLIAGLRFAV